MGQNGSMPAAAGQGGGYMPTEAGSGGVMQVMAEHPSSKKGKAFTSAQDALRGVMTEEFVPPKATSIIKATENAPEMGARGLAISAAFSNANPELVQWQLVR